MKRLTLMAAFVLLAAQSQASILTFDSPSTLGVSLSGTMYWNGDGGGHLYRSPHLGDASILFGESTFVSDFQMNAMPYQYYSVGQGFTIDVAAYNSSSQQLWSTMVDLQNYRTWDSWLTVPVGVGDVARLTFFSSYSAHGSAFWPSIDNMRINEQDAVVPEPAALVIWSLLGTVSAVLCWRRRRKAA